MNRRLGLDRAVCIGLVVFLLLIFFAAGHCCDHVQCPACQLTASFRLSLSLMTAALGLISLPMFRYRRTGEYAPATGGICSLVDLKVKLSD